MFGGHLREHSIEVGLVLFVDESVVEHSLGLVAEEPENMVVFTNNSWVCLEHPWNASRTLTTSNSLGSRYVDNIYPV